MSEATSEEVAGPVFRLIYRSRSRIAPPSRKAELGTIFSAARSKNTGLGVTGALLINDEAFVQALEGDETTVRGLYDRISKDPRHERIAVVDEKTVGARVFSRWSMARVADDDGEADIPLLMNRDKGGISPAAGRPTTPEQDELLDFMRGTLRDDVSV